MNCRKKKKSYRMSYLEGLPYTAIAQKVDKSVEWVRQLKRKGLRNSDTREYQDGCLMKILTAARRFIIIGE